MPQPQPESKPIADQIAPELPYLRRYARALCGSQEAGDTYVMATLEAIIADHALFDTALPPRVSIFRAFVRVWSSAPINKTTAAAIPGEVTAADRRIDQLTPLPRQAFLLTTLEEFSMEDAATILGVPTAKAAALVDTASREIAQQITTDVLIIEDEPMIALDIEELVKELGHRVCGLAATRSEANTLVETHVPGLILSDVQLADGSSGIDAVNDILQRFDLPVIFITAYPERLLTGERAEPTFLITKPFDPAMVKAVISQALFFDTKAKAGQAGGHA